MKLEYEVREDTNIRKLIRKRNNTGNNIHSSKALEDGNHIVKSICPNSDKLAWSF